MRERAFIKQKIDQWKELEETVASDSADPKKISQLFIQTTEDLSFARTHYKNRSVRVYLNLIANKIFAKLNNSRKGNVRRQFVDFWKEELPYVLWEARKSLALSVVIFLVAVGIGVFSSIKNDHFVNDILGDAYVNMTDENIANDDPMAVYKKMNQVDMFFGITYNNLRVTLMTFVTGIFMGLGSMLVMFHNGIMLGTFQYYFIMKGLFWESFLAVWLHGTIEISCIIIAGGAGMLLGKSWVFPGSYSRMQSLQIGARRSANIMLSVLPLIVVAGTIESFLTRYTEAPDMVRLGLIVASFSFILFYYVIYPYTKGRANKEKYANKIVPVYLANYNQRIEVGVLKENGQLITDVLKLLVSCLPKLIKVTATLSLFYAFSVNWNSYLENILDLRLDVEDVYNSVFFTYTSFNAVLLRLCSIFLLLYVSCKFLNTRIQIDGEAKRKTKLDQPTLIGLGLFSIAINLGFFIPINFWAVCYVFVMTSIAGLWVTARFIEGQGLKASWQSTFSVIRSGFWRLVGLNGCLFLLVFFFQAIFSSPLIWFYTDVLDINLPFNDTIKAVIMNSSLVILVVTNTLLVLPILIFSNAIIFYAIRERKDASYLTEAIHTMFMSKKSTYGMETE
ncbi:MAG: stage II sporulation protein M [Cyclobacteriaceae bacterium]